MTELERIREAMTAFLKGEGVAALTAWPGRTWSGRRGR